MYSKICRFAKFEDFRMSAHRSLVNHTVHNECGNVIYRSDGFVDLFVEIKLRKEISVRKLKQVNYVFWNVSNYDSC